MIQTLFGGGGYGSGEYGGGGNEIFSEPVAYYLSLITSEYQNSPNFLAFLQSFVQKFDDITSLLYMFDFDLQIDQAKGVQLDLIGTIVGANRTVDFQPRGGVSPVLDDATYRLLLYATIARNNWNGQIGSMQPIWSQLFPGGRIIVVDGQDMTVVVTMSGSFTSIIQDLITHDYIVPRAEGVLMQYNFAGLPIFGFDRNDAFIAGFDLGLWS